MRFIALLGLLFSLSLTPAYAASEKTFNAQTFTLDNGLEVVVVPNHRAPIVSHMIWYKFGAADEAPGQSGIAHFLEHLMFKGTPTVPNGQFSTTVKKMGGDDNAFTSQDYTAYYQNVPLNHLEKVMQMEADRMKNLMLTDEEVASERDVVIEERRQRIDNNPQSKMQEQLMSALFVNHPYSKPVIGWLHEIQQLTRDEAIDYYDKWYAPNNAILVVSGDITAEQLKPLARKYYGVIPPQMVPDRFHPAPAPIGAEHRVIMQDSRIGRPVLLKAYRSPRGSDAIDILSEILGGNSTARLYSEMVVHNRVAISAGATYDPVSLDDTTLTVYASPTPKFAISDIETALEAQIAQIIDKGVTADELDAAKKRKKASLTYYLDSLQGPAMVFGRALSSGFSVDYVENAAARIDQVTLDDVNKAAKAVFASGNIPVTGILLPEVKPLPTKGGKKK